MNSSIQGLSSLVKRAFDECKSPAEMKYIARALCGLYKSRENTIMEMLHQRISAKVH